MKFGVQFEMLIPILTFYLLTLCHRVTNENVIDNEVCQNGDQDCQNLHKNCRPFDISEYDENSKSIFYGEAKGRLGNQLLGYALLQHFRHKVGVDAYINQECKDYLMKVFTEDSVRVPVIEDTFCNYEEIPWKDYHGHIRDILTNKSYRKGKFIMLYPNRGVETSKGYRPEEHLSSEQEAMQKSYLKYLKQTLTFKPKIVTKMKIAMKQVAKKMGLKPKDVTYVGVHNRRTDSVEFIKRDWYQEPLREDYFEDAMDYFREEYDNVAFLYVSDDMEWGRKNIKNDQGDVFFVGEGNEDDESIGFDLAILINSNHTIISRGTYSMWGAVLNGGEYYTEYGTIVPEDLQGY